MHRTLAFRRHQDLKHKKRAKQLLKEWESYIDYNNPYFGGGILKRILSKKPRPTEDKRLIGKIATTPTRLSRGSSINIRAFGGVSRQELNNMLDTLDELEDLGYNSKILKKATTHYEDIWNYS